MSARQSVVAAFESELVRFAPRLFRVRIAKQYPPWAGHVSEDRLDAVIGERMAPAYEAGSDQADADLLVRGAHPVACLAAPSRAISCSRSISSLPPAIRARSSSRLIWPLLA